MNKVELSQGLDPDVIERAMTNRSTNEEIGRPPIPQMSNEDKAMIDSLRLRASKAKFLGEIRRDTHDTKSYIPINKIPSLYRLDYSDVLEVRTMSVPEVKRLSDISDENSSYVMNDILSKCCKTLSVDELYLGDRLFLILWIRYNTFPNAKHVVDFTCPKCGDSTFHFKLENLNIEYLKDEFDPNLEIVTNRGDVLKLSHLKVKHEKEIEKFRNKKEVRTKFSEEELDAEMLGLASMITEINGQTTQIEKELQDGSSVIVTNLMKTFPYVIDGSLDVDDFAMLVSYVTEHRIGVNPVMNITCEKCRGEFPMGFTFSPQFFIPKSPIRTNSKN